MSIEDYVAAEAAKLERARKVLNGAARDALPLTWLCDTEIHADTVDLVDKLLPQNGLAVIYGAPNAGKSTLALSMAFAIAHGAPWRQFETRSGLAYISAGEGRVGVDRRLVALRRQYPELRGGSLCCDWSIPNLRDPKAVVALIERIHEAESHCGEKCALLTCDTLSRHLYGSDNDAEHMGALLASCGAIRREIGCTVLLIHHSGKNPERGARGHSSLLGDADTEIEVTDESPHWLKVTKQRDGELLPPMAFDLTPVTLGRNVAGEDITAVVVEHRDLSPPRREPKGEKQLMVFEELKRRAKAGDVAWSQKQIADIAEGLKVSRTQSFMMGRKLLDGGFLKQSIGGLMLA